MTFYNIKYIKMKKEKTFDISSMKERVEEKKVELSELVGALAECLSGVKEKWKEWLECAWMVVKEFADKISETLKSTTEILKKLYEKFGEAYLTHYLVEFWLTKEDLEKMTDVELEHVRRDIMRLQTEEEMLYRWI